MFNDMNEDEIEKLKSKINSLQMENEQLYRSLTKANEQNRPLRDENELLNIQIGNMNHNTGILLRTIEKLEREKYDPISDKTLNTHIERLEALIKERNKQKEDRFLVQISTSNNFYHTKRFVSFLKWYQDYVSQNQEFEPNKTIKIYLGE